MTHQDLIEALIYDENIEDNLNVSNDYAPDGHGNNMVTIGFDGPPSKKKRGTSCVILFVFNKKGRLVSLEVANKIKGDRSWQVAASEPLVDFSVRYGTDGVVPKKKKN